MGFNEMVKCPKCGFGNRITDEKCLFCQTALKGAPSPEAKKPKKPRQKATKKPAPKTTPASNRRKTTTSKSSESESPKKESSSDTTIPTPPNTPLKTQRFSPQKIKDVEDTQEIVAADAQATEQEPLLAAAAGEDNGFDIPKRGQTKRLHIPGDGDLLFWLCCDPLDPIPLGYAKEVTVGRHAKNDLVLPHNEVSRFHASFKVRNGAITLEDLGSSNGIYINGIRRLQHPIRVGDQVTIGPYELVIKDRGESKNESNSDTDTLEKTTTTPSVQGFEEGKVALSGNLRDTPLAELMQGFEFNRKTGTMVVVQKKNKTYGWLAVVDGRPHSAGLGALKDREAVLNLLEFDEGHFTFYTNDPEGERCITGTITGLLLDASRRADEQGALPGVIDGLEE